MGHLITRKGIKPNPKKIKAIQKFPIPKTAKEIKSFLGLLGYYRKFINGFAKITKPFTKCLKKGATIEHTREFKDAFELCKQILCNDPILQYPDFEKPFILTTDASNVAIGAVLSQGRIGSDLPIAYASRTLNTAELNYSTVEKELLAIVFGTNYFRPYLFGRKFTIITDHKPLEYLFNLKEPHLRFVRWRLKLEEFDYQICYKKGKQNTNADALSRVEINMTENESVLENPGDIDEEINQYIRNEKNKNLTLEEVQGLKDIINPKIQNQNKINIISDIQLRPPREEDNETIHSALEDPILNIPITENCLNYYLNQIIFSQKNNGHYHVVKSNPFKTKNSYNHSYKLIKSNVFLNDVDNENRQKELIIYHHNKTCHRGINEGLLALSKLYYWPNMKTNLTEYINNCDTCQQAKYDRHPPKIKFSLTPTPSQPLESIHIDTFQICNVKFLTIIDIFSRYAQAYPLEPSYTATIILDNLSTFITHHGLPQQITCDNGTEFKTSLLLDFCKLHNISIHFTTPGNSNSNSPVERFHSTLIELFRILKLKNPKATTKQLIQFSIIGYNSSVHSVTKQRPFDVINGRVNSLDPFDLTDEIILNKYVSDRRERLKTIYEKIYETSLNNKNRLNQKQNEKRENPPELKPDTTVYVTDKTAKRSKDKPRRKPVVIDQDIGNKIITRKKKVIYKSQIQRPKAFVSSQVNEQDGATPSCSYAVDNISKSGQ